MWWLAGLSYLVCCVLSYGLIFAFFQKEFSIVAIKHYQKDKKFAFWSSILGPLSLSVCFLLGHCKHGFKWK